MKILVIGQGGREHAIVKALSLSPQVTEVHCMPGNDGIARDCVTHNISLHEAEKVIQICRQIDFKLIVIGPEQPLAEGLADKLRAAGFSVFGPDQKSATFEASKSFCKDFLLRHKIPTAKAVVVKSVEQTLAAARDFKPPYVLKADGLAAGKGVVICETLEELKSHAQLFFEKKILGSAGATAILEEHMRGWEMSVFILTNGKSYVKLPIAQDHKRLLEKDKGPNTGGMGTVAPLHIDAALEPKIEEQILKPIIKGFIADNVDYRGVLFIGLMITDKGPQVLEFNVRFGDPETQVLMPLIDGDWAPVLLAIANGEMPHVKWKKNLYTACVVMAAQGYPEAPVKDAVISGNVLKQTSSSYFLHAGTKLSPHNEWLTAGGRVMNAVGIGSTQEEALKHAYSLIDHVKWTGMQIRRDIGSKN